MSGTSQTVGVLGAGTMGVGIAVVMARAGHRVILRDMTEERAERGADGVRAFLDRSVSLGKLAEDVRDEAARTLTPTTELEALEACDVVVEAIFEDTELKATTFAELEEICRPDTLFHSNTSTLSVTAIAAKAKRPGRVLGTHYCNPAPLMKLVEVVKARQTDNGSYRRTVEFLEGLGKVTVTTPDVPGFIVNRFLVPFENDCIRALAAGVADAETIDRAVTAGLGYPMGTFQLLDIVGMDIHHAVSMSLFEQLRDPRFAPPPLISQMIAAGELGRKTGRGFYRYDDDALFGAGKDSAAKVAA
jgi:3-hydroxybutyryl-CoA dehydrogenase